MIAKDYYLIAFDGAHAAMSAEAYFKNMNVRVKLIPLPSAISAGCGFSIRVLPSEMKAVEELLRRSEIEWSELYKIVKVGSKSKVEPWILQSNDSKNFQYIRR